MSTPAYEFIHRDGCDVAEHRCGEIHHLADPICPFCGYDVPDDSQFCNRCGCKIDRYGCSDAKFCRVCGYRMEPGHSFCKGCGTPVNGGPNPYASRVDDSGSIGWAILGFFFPLVGFILWLVWIKEKPMCSRMSGLGALACFILTIVAPIAFILILVLFGVY